ncbi:hypothetical protein Fot_06231 [Forsythia ovata]|uniref:Uncharacterized protein n=1 Tax=Forsythia ovata TaxID=205694 RepID=A0ABD1WSD5_9LAMI
MSCVMLEFVDMMDELLDNDGIDAVVRRDLVFRSWADDQEVNGGEHRDEEASDEGVADLPENVASGDEAETANVDNAETRVERHWHGLHQGRLSTLKRHGLQYVAYWFGLKAPVAPICA